MPKVSVPKLAMRPPHRLLLIFASTILVPGILLAFFGLRALVQESRLVDQQIRERLRGAGQTAARRLERELSEWRQAIDQLGQSGATDPALWPARVRLATKQPGSAVVLLREKDRVQAFPAGQLPYILSPVPAASSPVRPRLASWAEAELAELREKNYDKAIRLYRRFLGSAKRFERVILLHRVARSLRKAGRQPEALRAFRVLMKEPSTPVGLLPSDLLALTKSPCWSMNWVTRRSGPACPCGSIATWSAPAGRWRSPVIFSIPKAPWQFLGPARNWRV